MGLTDKILTRNFGYFYIERKAAKTMKISYIQILLHACILSCLFEEFLCSGKPWCRGRNYPGGRNCCQSSDPNGKNVLRVKGIVILTLIVLEILSAETTIVETTLVMLLPMMIVVLLPVIITTMGAKMMPATMGDVLGLLLGLYVDHLDAGRDDKICIVG